MFQIIFNELSAAEISSLPKKLQLELLAQFQILPADLDQLDSERFGVIEREGKKLYRYRAKDYRIYFAVDLDAFVGLREINPVIFRAVAIQFFSLAFDDAEPFRVELIQIRGQYLKLGQQLELQFLRQRRDLSGAQFIKDDLEHQRSNINSPHPRANPGNDLPCNCSGLFSEFYAGYFLAPIPPHENNFVAHLHIIDVADVDHHQIHRYPANKGATLPAHQDGGATIGKMPWITIGVTGRQGCDPHFSRSDKRATITDGAPFRHIANKDNSRFPCHHWLEQFLKFRQRRNPVKHDAGAHDLERRRIERECACALQDMRSVTSRNFGANPLDDSSKSDELAACEFCVFVRDRHVGRDAVNVDVRQLRHAFENFARFVFHYAHSPHAGVDFEIDRHRPESIERLRFFQTGDRRNKSALGDDRSFLRSCRAEDNDGMGERCAQRECLFQIGDAK